MSLKICFSLTIVVLLITSSWTKTIENISDFELSKANASRFLYGSQQDIMPAIFGKREIGRNCVRCKFGIRRCCKPDICRKRTFFNECMEVKTADSNIFI